MKMKEYTVKVSNTGDKYWFMNGKLHCEDGPAIKRANGTKEWFLNALRHREDGPAVEFENGIKEWYLDGKELSEEEFNNRNKPLELTLEQIAEKFGVSVNKLKIKA
jgi:hypothetical protein